MTHPVGALSKEYTTVGCPTDKGMDWSIEVTKEALSVGPHVSTLVPEAMEQMQKEEEEKEQKGQVQVVLWNEIKKAPTKS